MKLLLLRSTNNHFMLVLPLLLLAFYLRLDDLGELPLRWDEAFSVWEAQMDFHVLTEFTASDVHPPLYFWLLHAWTRLAGISEFAIRALSVFFGLLSAPAIYSLTRQLTRRRLAAAFALLLVSLSPFHLQWSQDARMYALATVCASLMAYAYWRGWMRLLVIGGVGAILSHYFGAIALGVIVIHRLMHWNRMPRQRRPWIGAIVCILAVCALWALYAADKIRTDSSFATFDPLTVFKLKATLFSLGEPANMYTHFPLALAIAALYFAGLALCWRYSRRATSLIILGALAPPAIIASLGLPFIPVHVNALQERHFVIFSPFVFAGFGLCFASLARYRRLRWLALIAGAALIVLNASLLAAERDARYFKDHYRSMMAAVAALAAEDDLVFFTSGSRKPVVYYNLDRAGYSGRKDSRAEPLNVRGIPTAAAGLPAMMERVFSGATRFWLIEIEAHHDQPLNARVDWLNKRYHRLLHIPVGWNGLSLYSLDEGDAIPDIAAIIPPAIREARPGDQARIGVPAGQRVDLVHSGQIIDSKIADTWMLHQFDIYAFYFNGDYTLHVGDERYPFKITHSQDFPGAFD